MLIINGIYRFRPKHVAFPNDYCLSCSQPRRSVQIRTFDTLHIFWIPILPLGFHNAGSALFVAVDLTSIELPGPDSNGPDWPFCCSWQCFPGPRLHLRMLLISFGPRVSARRWARLSPSFIFCARQRILRCTKNSAQFSAPQTSLELLLPILRNSSRLTTRLFANW